MTARGRKAPEGRRPTRWCGIAMPRELRRAGRMERRADPLYEAQLAKRTGARLAPVAALTDDAAPRLAEFHPPKSAAAAPGATRAVEIVHGRFVVDGKTLWGGVVNEGWWRGQEVPAEALEVGGV